ncbi:type II secretion system protein N [Phenylobacterium sp.]|uniref:type II secretion system protein N n=1 Tax=Phenylobacterium sp. TaxID=1871053 RepID=UPI0035B0EA5D
MKLTLDSLRAVRPRTALIALEAVLAVGLAIQAGRLVWLLVTPLGPFGEAPRPQPATRAIADLSILASFDPFFRVQGAAAAGQATGSSDAVILYGVRAGSGGRGSAILAAGGGPQRSYGVGEEVSPGLVLAVVGADHVILSRGGARQRVGFPVPQPGAAVLPAVSTLSGPSLEGPAASRPGPAIDPQRLLGQTTLVPRMRDGRPSGYTVLPRGGSDVLRQAGLQQGDVLLAIDGVALTPERVSELPQSLAASTAAEIRFERGGQTLTTRIRMAPQ